MKASLLQTIKAVSEILATVDNLERALANEQEDYEGLKKGVQMTYDGLMASLKKLGVEATASRAMSLTRIFITQ